MSKLRQLGMLNDEKVPPAAVIPAPARKAPKRDQLRHIALAKTIWAEALEPRDTVVEAYLNSRGLALPGRLQCLRYHPRCPRGSDRLPAMIAEMCSPTTNEFLGVHRTFLRADGSGKADMFGVRASVTDLAS